MKTIQKTNYVIGNEVFFIEKGIPHTGIVKEVYENLLILNNVTFLDPIFDKTIRESIENEIWEVSPEDVIKTSEYHFPVYPSTELIVYISQIMHSATNDNQLSSIIIRDFLREYKPKMLYSSETSLFYPYPDNYISFNPDMIIQMSAQNGFYVPLLIKYEDIIYYALELYDKSLTQPSMIIFPEWKDSLRPTINSPDKFNSALEDMKNIVKNIYQCRANNIGETLSVPEFYISSLNEDSIESIHQITAWTKEKYFDLRTIVTHCGCYLEEGSIKMLPRFFNPVYKKRR